MKRERFNIMLRFLVVLLLSTLALPAWGAQPFKKTMFGKVAIIAQSGGDYTSPITAMENVALWCGTPSAANPCLVKIMPGVYDLAGGSLTMQPYVDIEGSGETTTIITSEYLTYSSTGVVNGADNAEIRFLSVKNVTTSGGGLGIAIANNSQSPKITHVTAIASAGTGRYGVYNSSSSPVMNDVTATAMGGGSNFGIYNSSSSPTMINVTATATGDTTITCGVYNVSSSPFMYNVTVNVTGHDNSGVYNSSSSPTMVNVTVSASGGVTSRGVHNYSSSPFMNNVTVTSAGGTNTYGVLNSNSSSPIMSNVTVTASGGSGCFGVYNTDSSPTMSNVTCRALTGVGGFGYGMSSSASSAVTILADRSTFEGSRNSFTNGSNITLRIGGSKLIGTASNNGTLTCVDSYDGNYVALGANCQ